MPKKAAVKLWHRAREFDRQSHEPGRHGGAVGRAALAVLHALGFDFANFRTGRMDPSYKAIAHKAGSVRAVSDALKHLRELGLLHRIRRCVEDWRAAAGDLLAGLEATSRAAGACTGHLGRPPPPLARASCAGANRSFTGVRRDVWMSGAFDYLLREPLHRRQRWRGVITGIVSMGAIACAFSPW